MGSEIRLFTRLRKGKVSLWIDVDGEKRNIWDISKRTAQGGEVFDAIRSAIQIGMEIQNREQRKLAFTALPVMSKDWQVGGINEGD